MSSTAWLHDSEILRPRGVSLQFYALLKVLKKRAHRSQVMLPAACCEGTIDYVTPFRPSDHEVALMNYFPFHTTSRFCLLQRSLHARDVDSSGGAKHRCRCKSVMYTTVTVE
ncbi:hypothetical protein CEXT_608981 [Caerostris extrusa]|uniref:Uncharacterized protein n=1 Tax=Caerostris extrusa TaxID=172846 RepID=A0AAV4XG25_CAEEX|nr:hypothetical protein CEXT_608981 [Caerostris extrusa]